MTWQSQQLEESQADSSVGDDEENDLEDEEDDSDEDQSDAEMKVSPCNISHSSSDLDASNFLQHLSSFLKNNPVDSRTSLFSGFLGRRT